MLWSYGRPALTFSHQYLLWPLDKIFMMCTQFDSCPSSFAAESSRQDDHHQSSSLQHDQRSQGRPTLHGGHTTDRGGGRKTDHSHSSTQVRSPHSDRHPTQDHQHSTEDRRWRYTVWYTVYCGDHASGRHLRHQHSGWM